MTTHGDQIFQFGGIPVASNGLLPAGARLVAPTGDYAPYKHWYPRWKRSKFHTTIPVAYNACAGSKNEVVHLTVGDHTLTETLTWSKNNTHLVGSSPTRFQPHLDIWQSGAFTPMLEISGRGNVLANMTIRHGTAAEDVVGALISGRYNTFENVYFYTPQVAAQDVAAYRGVRITGHNNYFKSCRFGADGVSRDGENYNVTIEGVGNVFEDCTFIITIDGTAPHFLGFCIDYARDCRVTMFRNCTFIAYSADWGVALGEAIGIGVSIAGGLYFDSRCQFINVTKVCATATGTFVWMASPGAAAATAYTGKAVRQIGE